jgi:hypothetical protein
MALFENIPSRPISRKMNTCRKKVNAQERLIKHG